MFLCFKTILRKLHGILNFCLILDFLHSPSFFRFLQNNNPTGRILNNLFGNLDWILYRWAWMHRGFFFIINATSYLLVKLFLINLNWMIKLKINKFLSMGNKLEIKKNKNKIKNNYDWRIKLKINKTFIKKHAQN